MAKSTYEVLQKYATDGMAPHEIRELHGKDNQNFAVINKVFPNIKLKLEKDGFLISSIDAATEDDIKNAAFVKSTFVALQRGFTAKKKVLTEHDIITTAQKVIEGDKKYIDALIGAKEPKKAAPVASFDKVLKPKTDKLPRREQKSAAGKPRSKTKDANQQKLLTKNAFTFKNLRLAHKILDGETIQKIETAYGIKIEHMRSAVIEKEGQDVTMQAVVSGGISAQRDQALHTFRDIQKEYILREADAFTGTLKNIDDNSKKDDFDLNQHETDVADQLFNTLENHLKPLRSVGMKAFRAEIETARQEFKVDGGYKQITATAAKTIFSDLYLKYDEVVADTKPGVIGDELKVAVLKISDIISNYNDEQTQKHLNAKKNFSNKERSEYGSMIGGTLKEQKIELDEAAKKILTYHTYKAIDDVFVEGSKINEIIEHYSNNKNSHKIGFGADAYFSNVLIPTKLQTIRPKNDYQVDFITHLQNPEKTLVLGLGSAGTGKTFLSVAHAAANFASLKRLILTRPVVEAGENLGFMPGNMKEKLDPYMRPYYDGLEETLCNATELDKHIASKKIEIAPLAFMRGRTFKGTQHQRVLVILDEAQNTTYGQIKLFLTRMGEYCDVIITGDVTQTDLPLVQRNGQPLPLNNRPGLPLLLRMLEMQKENSVAITQFPDECVERSSMAKMAVKGFAELEEMLAMEEEQEKETQRFNHIVGKGSSPASLTMQ